MACTTRQINVSMVFKGGGAPRAPYNEEVGSLLVTFGAIAEAQWSYIVGFWENSEEDGGDSDDHPRAPNGLGPIAPTARKGENHTRAENPESSHTGKDRGNSGAQPVLTTSHSVC